MLKKIIGFLFITATLCVFIFSCGNNPSEGNEKNEGKTAFGKFWRSLAGNFSNSDTFYIQPGAIDSFLLKYPEFNTFKPDLEKFYSERDSAFAWYDRKGLIEQAAHLVNRLDNIDHDLPGDTVMYYEPLMVLMDRPNRSKNREELELMLTSQYFFIAHKIWQGMSDKEVKKQGWYVPREKVSTTEYLDSLLKNDASLKEEPVNPMYFKLREQISRYRDILQQNPNLPEIQYVRDLKPGDTAAVISEICQRLYLLGDLKKAYQSNLFDDQLLEAVHTFQERHGIKVSDIINKKFTSALNIPLVKRLEKLVINLERARWLPAAFSDSSSYILVNIPEFMVRIWEGEQPVWESRVVVGEDNNRTVIFRGMLDHIVFSPHWNIPESIVVNEILPSLEKDKDYLKKQQLEIVDESGDIPVIRQKPGKENALGQVKFMFPNTYNIYLHDSPAKHLYDREVRTYSHGCIRVEKAEELAVTLLKETGKWDREAVKQAMESGEEKYVKLPRKLPVYILYFTTWVDENNRVHFGEDIYGYDARLAASLFKETGGINLNKALVFRE